MARLLFIRLGDALGTLPAAADAKGTLSAFGTTYEELVLGGKDFLGFYDWLRNTSGTVVGLRLSLAGPASSLATMIRDAPYLVREGGNTLQIMFRRADDIDWEASMDQDFGRTRAFRHSGGDIVLMVDAEALSDEEFAAVAGSG